ncbi:Creatinase/aminopeptidase [Suillus paluster]|uniref:Creatinase/aminopeptidase n=1 Tax=Suillus paluster TaxID=48578 RepID=UPI001B8834F2|nr:Creatinase/aminopeptidase [Suillus paluster]KAG1727777.1 Creatinase/aminopeptidase [Suillus paluster]
MSGLTYCATAHVQRTFEQLMNGLPTQLKDKPQVILLAGGNTTFRNDTDRELPFRQESNFYYLTGCSVPGSFLLALYQPEQTDPSTRLSVKLSIPAIEVADLMWSVPPPTIEEAKQLFDVADIAYSSELQSAIDSLLESHPEAVFHTLPRNSPLFPTHTATDAYLLSSLHRTRLIKDENEISMLRRANDISSRAHETVMRVLGNAVQGKILQGNGAGIDRPLLPGEWLIEKEAEAEAIFVASCRREGAVHQAYLPIVAASKRAATLHYCCNDRDFTWGPVKPHDHLNHGALAHGPAPERQLEPQVLLIDAGCEWDCYSADITRTMPVGNGGKFTEKSKQIYSLVLEMQQKSIATLRPGVHWDTIHLLCHQILVEGFLSLGLFKGSKDEILRSGISSAFFPHGVGHSLGMDVHDVPSASKPVDNTTIPQDNVGHPKFYTYLRLRLPLAEGMVVTVEPGIYFHEHLLKAVEESEYVNHDLLKEYREMGGVRIEDDVLITSDGCENLTKVRSDVEWLELVCSGEI